MTATPRLSSSQLADRLLAVAEMADLAAAGLQVATWPAANPRYEPVGCLLSARNHLRHAAHAVDPVGLGFNRTMMTKSVVIPTAVQTVGCVVGIVLAVLLSPAPTVWYVLPAVLVGWMAAYRLVRHLQYRLAWARLRAADDPPNDPGAPLKNLADAIDDLQADIQPELSPGRRAASNSALAAAQQVLWAAESLPPEMAAK